MDQQAKQQIAERLKTANNVLVTVSTNPSVDQLAATIGFTLLLNKLGKHGTAVFSGSVPSTLEFLRPEATIEKTTDSLRDFIIALDKTKADKLRYKVEDKVVKIFITPYRASLSEKDLDFSQGDFNVDVVVALGVREPKDLDTAIITHGRILHDATVISINVEDKGTLGSINWSEPLYSSLCELLVSLGEELGPNLFDAQMATAFLTGIVAETKRFSNDKTSPHTMTVAARLMSMGANQQLIATKLEKSPPPPAPKQPPKPQPKADKPKTPSAEEFDKVKLDELVKEKPKTEEKKPNTDGSLKIDHTPPPPALSEEQTNDQIRIDTQGTLHRLDEEAQRAADKAKESKQELLDDNLDAKDDEAPRRVLESPTSDSKLTANTEPERYDPSTDPLTLPLVPSPLLNRFAPTNTKPLVSNEALSGTEEPAGNPIVSTPAAPTVPSPDAARDAINEALQSAPNPPLEPIAALNAQTVDLGKADVTTPSSVTLPTPAAPVGNPPTLNQPFAPPAPLPPPASTPAPVPSVPLPPHLTVPPSSNVPLTNASGPATPPPPVPPPMMPPAFGQPPTDDENTPSQPLAPL